MDAEVMRDVGDRPLALHRQPHTALDQFIGVLLRTGHGDGASPPARTESSLRSLRETRPGSAPASSTPTSGPTTTATATPPAPPSASSPSSSASATPSLSSRQPHRAR